MQVSVWSGSPHILGPADYTVPLSGPVNRMHPRSSLGQKHIIGSPGIPVVTRQISLPRRAKPLEIFGRPLNDVLFSREFRESHMFCYADSLTMEGCCS